jgi:hypothetical protein
VASFQSGELSGWRAFRVASCQGGELKSDELSGGELYGHRAKGHTRQIRSRVVAKSAESGEPVFTSMDVLLYGLSL